MPHLYAKHLSSADALCFNADIRNGRFSGLIQGEEKDVAVQRYYYTISLGQLLK